MGYFDVYYCLFIIIGSASVSAQLLKIRWLPVPVHRQSQEAFGGNQSELHCCFPPLQQGLGGGSVACALPPAKSFKICLGQ